MQLFFIFGDCFRVARSIKKGRPEKMERNEVLECDMIVRNLQSLKHRIVQDGTWLKKPADSCVHKNLLGSRNEIIEILLEQNDDDDIAGIVEEGCC